MAKTVEQRFWKHVGRCGPDECWLWTGARTSTGRGNMRVRSKTELAHRISYQIHNGEIPAGLLVLHRCDNGACVNPRHLFLGDHNDNMIDAVNKGRKDCWKKLGEENIPTVLSMRESGQSMRKIAKAMGVSVKAIFRVLHGITYHYANQ